jgi:shikimate kinase
MGKTVRPLLLHKTPEEVQTFIRQQLSEREPFYLQAQHVLDVNLMDNYEKIKITVDQLEKMIK